MKEEKNALLLLTLSSKKCACCGEVKLTTEFTKKNDHGKWGFYSYCKECNNKKSNKYRLENPEKRKKAVNNSIIKRKYGITTEDKERMLKNQGYKCAICGEELFLFGDLKNKNKIAHIDHDHKTGKVRGLLCNDCNRGIGLLKDNPLFLVNAIKYLEN